VTVRISLALQGGGAHGAFTWGVLERLLDEPGIEVAGISGTSAGALNGAAFKAGLLENGRRGAKAQLARLWRQVGAIGDWRMQPWLNAMMPFARIAGEVAEAMMPVSPQGLAAQIFSPYAYGPAWRNPLEPVVRKFRFDRVCADEPPAFFVSATNVRTGRIRVFQGAEISAETILASACLPTLFQAVEVHDPATGAVEAFWDGGYTGNPALFPLFRDSLPEDIVIVSINPLRRDALPRTPVEIQSRINEISFNASLLGELRAIRFVKELIAEGRIARGTMKDVRIHIIADDALMNDLSATTKIAPTPFLLHRLRMAGQAAADRFLRDHGQNLGHAPSVDLAALLD
jgi:NTE family protein